MSEHKSKFMAVGLAGLALAMVAASYFGSLTVVSTIHDSTNYLHVVLGNHQASVVRKISPSNLVAVQNTVILPRTNLAGLYIRSTPATNTAQISLIETNGTFATVLEGPKNLTNNFLINFPTNHPTAGQVLSVQSYAGNTVSLTYSNDATGGAGASGPVTNAQMTLVVDGGGSVITTGAKGWTRAKDTFTITGWDITADQSGSCVVDVWKDTYANFPPTVADTIAGTEKPTLSAAQKNQDVALGSWTTAVTKGDYIRFNVDSASTVTYLVVTIYGY